MVNILLALLSDTAVILHGGLSMDHAGAAPLPPSPRIEHSYPPSEYHSVLNYSCKDGYRNLFLVYRKDSNADRLQSLTRNGKFVSREVIQKINKYMASFDGVVGISPECHSDMDVLFIVGKKKYVTSMMMVSWSLHEARLDMDGRYD